MGGFGTAPFFKLLGPLAFQARLATDPARPEQLYLTWLQAADTGNLSFPSTGNPINLIRSDDAGASWTEPVRVTPAARERVVAPSLRVGPDGPFLSYLDLGDDRLDYHGGHEGRGGQPYGGTWSAGAGPVDRRGPHLEGVPAAAGPGRRRAPRRRLLRPAVRPRRREERGLRAVVVRRRRSFTPRVAVSDRSFDSRIGFGSERDMADLGSRLALAAGPHASLAVWTDTRAGTEASGKQDLAQGVVGIEAGSHWRFRLRLASLLLLAAVLCIGVRLARRPAA